MFSLQKKNEIKQQEANERKLLSLHFILAKVKPIAKYI